MTMREKLGISIAVSFIRNNRTSLSTLMVPLQAKWNFLK